MENRRVFSDALDALTVRRRAVVVMMATRGRRCLGGATRAADTRCALNMVFAGERIATPADARAATGGLGRERGDGGGCVGQKDRDRRRREQE